MRFAYLFLGLVGLFSACKSTQNTPTPPPTPPSEPSIVQNWIVGDTSDTSPSTQPLLVLMGGSTDVDVAIRAMISASGGGDFVVLRASGSNGYNDYIYRDLGGVHSVETFLVNTRDKAADARLIRRVRQAEAVFIAGGDQANYVNFWKDTPLEAALNHLISTKRVPVGGTSAGCAILGKAYFSAINGTIRSEEAIANPFDTRITLSKDDFIEATILNNILTDTHYDNPDRRGRHIVFLARLAQNTPSIKGIGVEERTAVVIDGQGKAQVVGTGKAYFIGIQDSAIEQLTANQPLVWDRSARALRVYALAAATSLNNTRTFALQDWQTAQGGSWQYWSVKNQTVVVVME